jgi:hypothetical protein
MDERKILIVNLSRGLIGEDNASLLGALLVTKIQLASMSRADIPVETRVPFYLYVDEFQNFATDSFATILSEARKYALNLTVANQYIAQMSPEVKDAVFGNVGSMIAFRMGADDARGMQRYFEPQFEEYDLVHMNNRNVVINMTIAGEKTPAFSATTLNLPEHYDDETANIIEHSRRQFGTPRSEVEAYVGGRYLLDVKPQGPSEAKPTKKEQPKAQPQPEAPKAIEKPKEDPVNREAPVNRVAGMGHTAINAAQTVVAKTKRKRRRSKKNKATATVASAESPSPETVVIRPEVEKVPAPTPASTPEPNSLNDSAEHVIFTNKR